MQSRWRVALFCFLGVAVNASLFGPALRLSLEGINDFMSIYSGARLAFTGGMYELARNLQVQQETAGWENINRLFLRPPFDALLVWPLGQLPYRQAVIAWDLVIVLAIAGFCYLWPGDRKVAAMVCCWSFPLFDGLADGQDLAILVLATGWALREFNRERPLRAGMIFALCSIKMHLFLLLPVLLLTQKRWRMGAGLGIGGAMLFAISFLPGGWNWPQRYLALLKNPITNPWADAMPSIHGLTANLPHASLWQALGMACAVAMVWMVCRKGSFALGLAAALVGGILVAPHAYLQDCALTVPALLITQPIANHRWERYIHILLFSPLLCIWTMLNLTWITTLALIAYVAWLTLRPAYDQRSDCNKKKILI